MEGEGGKNEGDRDRGKVERETERDKEREILYLLQPNRSVLSVAEIMVSNLKMLLLAAVSCLFACLFVCLFVLGGRKD